LDRRSWVWNTTSACSPYCHCFHYDNGHVIIFPIFDMNRTIVQTIQLYSIFHCLYLLFSLRQYRDRKWSTEKQRIWLTFELLILVQCCRYCIKVQCNHGIDYASWKQLYQQRQTYIDDLIQLLIHTLFYPGASTISNPKQN